MQNMKAKKQTKKSQFEMFEMRLARLCARNSPLAIFWDCERDRINAILAGCGFNLMKLYRAAALFVRILLLKSMAARADIRQTLQLGGETA